LDLISFDKSQRSTTLYNVLFVLGILIFPKDYIGEAAVLVDIHMSSPLKLWVAVTINVIINFSCCFLMLMTFYGSVLSESVRRQILKEIGNLMRVVKETEEEDSRVYPPLNILDHHNLEAWSILRKIFKDIGTRQKQILNWNFAVLFIYQCVLKPINDFKDIPEEGFILVLVRYIISHLVQITSLILLIYFQRSLNKQFPEHSMIIKESKKEAVRLYRNYEQSSSKRSKIKMEALGFDFLRSIPLNDLAARKKKLEKAYDFVIKDIKDEEKNYPHKLLGLNVNTAMMLSPILFLARALLPKLFKIS